MTGTEILEAASSVGPLFVITFMAGMAAGLWIAVLVTNGR